MLSVTNEKYKGWEVLVLQNRWLKLFIAPQLGGRLIQLMLAEHPYFFVHPKLEGKDPGETRLGENGAWLNWGGEKIWPAPQGWQSKKQWPGPPDPVLDGGIYQCSDISNEEKRLSVILTSPVDTYTGLQSEKKVWLDNDTSTVDITATFRNRSGHPIRWSIWSVCQLNAPEPGPENQYLVVCPVNTKSAFENGYKVMHGLVNNPQYKKDDEGNFVVDFQYLIGKTGLDTDKGWVAFHDRKGGVFVYRYTYEAGRTYPDDTSVQIWTQGWGQIYSRNQVADFPNDHESNPPYIELELLSPLKEILPGESFSFYYRMQVSCVPPGAKIKTITGLAIICQSLEMTVIKDRYNITGQYGVFQKGRFVLEIHHDNGKKISSAEKEVSPLEGVKIEVGFSREAMPSGLLKAVLLFFDDDRKMLGVIDQTIFQQEKQFTN